MKRNALIPPSTLKDMSVKRPTRLIAARGQRKETIALIDELLYRGMIVEGQIIAGEGVPFQATLSFKQKIGIVKKLTQRLRGVSFARVITFLWFFLRNIHSYFEQRKK